MWRAHPGPVYRVELTGLTLRCLVGGAGKGTLEGRRMHQGLAGLRRTA